MFNFLFIPSAYFGTKYAVYLRAILPVIGLESIFLPASLLLRTPSFLSRFVSKKPQNANHDLRSLISTFGSGVTMEAATVGFLRNNLTS